MRENTELKGLGGWLILVGIGLILSVVIIPVGLYPLFEILDPELWSSLAEFQPETFNPTMRLVVYAELLANALLFMACLYLIFLFFKKHYLFPRCFIAIQVTVVVMILVDSYVISLFNPDMPALDLDTLKSFSRSSIMAAIWISYMLKSERVKLTFVEKRPS